LSLKINLKIENELIWLLTTKAWKYSIKMLLKYFPWRIFVRLDERYILQSIIAQQLLVKFSLRASIIFLYLFSLKDFCSNRQKNNKKPFSRLRDLILPHQIHPAISGQYPNEKFEAIKAVYFRGNSSWKNDPI
jgi:hypothetical protein